MCDHTDKKDDRALMTRRHVAKAMAKVPFVALAIGAGALMIPQRARAGYGACSVSGCPCQAFIETPGNSYMCQNCGHQYSMHW